MKEVLSSAAFVACILTPLAVVIGSLPDLRRQAPWAQIPLSGLLAIALCAPLYYLRRVFPPVWYDATLCGLLPCAAAFTHARAGRPWVPKGPRRVAALLAIVLLAGIGIMGVRLGFERQFPSGIGYWGLLSNDFLNLSGIVTCIRESPFPAEMPLAGGGPLHYHWLLLVTPAWISEFLGNEMRVTSALSVFTLLVAILFVLTLRLIVCTALRVPAPTRRSDLLLAAALFGGFGTYAFQWIVSLVPSAHSWFGERNALLLSPLNAILNFPNVTLALTAALVLLALLADWNVVEEAATARLLAVSAVLVAAGSVLFVPPIVVGAAFLFAGSAVRAPARLAGLSLPILVIGALLLRLAGYWGGGVSQSLAFEFDGGRFVLRLLAGAAATILLASIARRRRDLGVADLAFALGALTVPSFFVVRNSSTAPSDLSMKIATLFTVALIVRAIVGLSSLLERRESYPAAITISVILLSSGLLSSAVYLGQFPLARVGILTSRWKTVDADLFAALAYVRTSVPRTTPVLADVDLGRQEFDAVLSLGERRPWLAGRFLRRWSEGNQPLERLMDERETSWNGMDRDDSLRRRVSSSAVAPIDIVVLTQSRDPQPSGFFRSARFGRIDVLRPQAVPLARVRSAL